jgi:hypothetical protein
MNVLHHGHEPGVVYALAVHGRHIVAAVAHHVIHGYLVAAVAGHGLKTVP